MVEKITKGEHFHGNNPDMKLNFEKPDKAQIDEMNYKKPITSFKGIEANKPDTSEMYLGGMAPTLNVDYVDNKDNYVKNDGPALTKDGRLSSGTN
tara:strand:- start:151 stop:435 length:285 start_codon:yes stop_codon:yes gene_type:complete